MDAKKIGRDDTGKKTPAQNLEQPNTGDNDIITASNKKKHKSALSASQYIRSAVDHVKGHSYQDVNYMHTGTNVSYREEDSSS